MPIFDLVFIALFLASVVTLIVAAVSALRGGRWRSILIRYGVCFAIYMAVVFAVALAKPQSILRVGDIRCFDDWCIAITGASHAAVPEGIKYDVAIQISSRARRVRQRAKGVAVYLTDDRGRRFDPMPDANAGALDMFLDPGQSADTTRRFILPGDARDVGLVTVHGGSYCFPGCFIIGNTSIVGKETIVRLP
jgi:hypothetical protein